MAEKGGQGLEAGASATWVVLIKPGLIDGAGSGGGRWSGGRHFVIVSSSRCLVSCKDMPCSDMTSTL